MSWLRRVPVAHRGLHDIARGIPENSIAAARAAIAKGYAIELDVQLSGDGVVMVFHDDRLKRLTGAEGRIGKTTAAALRRMTLLGTREHVPTFREFLDAVGGRAPLLIEIKNFEATVGPLEAGTLRDLRDYKGEIAVQGFNPASVEWFRRHAPAIPRGQLRVDLVRSRFFTVAQRLRFHRGLRRDLGKPDFVGWGVAHLNAREARRAHEAGRALLCWTVRTEASKRKARALGANIIFEAVTP